MAMSVYVAGEVGRSVIGSKSYPKDDVSKVVPVTPSLSSRWLGIAAALLGLNIIRSRRRRVGDGEALIRRDRLDDNATCTGTRKEIGWL
jgi:hypothetical protein